MKMFRQLIFVLFASSTVTVMAASGVPIEFHGRWAPVKDASGFSYSSSQNKEHCSTGGYARSRKGQGDEGSLSALSVSRKSVSLSFSESSLTVVPRKVEKDVAGLFVASAVATISHEEGIDRMTGKLELKRTGDALQAVLPTTEKINFVRCK